MSKFEAFDGCDANAIRHDLAEHTEGLWRKNANVTRAYPADLRFLAKKEILVDLGLWEPIGSASAGSPRT